MIRRGFWAVCDGWDNNVVRAAFLPQKMYKHERFSH